MDFGIYPPEINSGRMYTGPGSGPMLAAAQAWEALADELYTAAGSYRSVVTALISGTWAGPSSAAMAVAAESFVTWLSATAVQAEETAIQAKAAAAAYEAAFALTVPPPMIAANRSLLMALVATNFFGQNTPAIAATEAQYAEMWAQDAAAMAGYASSSALATVLTPFSPPRQNTAPGGLAGQAAAVGHAATTPAGHVQSTVSGVSQGVSLADPPALATPLDVLNTLSNLVTVFLDAPTYTAILSAGAPMEILGGIVDLPPAYLGTVAGLHTDDDVSGWAGVEPWPGTAQVPPAEFRAIITNPGPLATSPPTVSASLGQANTIGTLSVPPRWAVEAPAVRPTSMTLPMSSATSITPAVAAAAAETTQAELGSPFTSMGLAGMLGSAMAGGAGTDGGKVGAATPEKRTAARIAEAATDKATGDKPAPSPVNPRIVVTGVAARIRQLAELRSAGILTEEEYAEHKNRLLGR
ncbi:PPE domain-containing protein [Mycobacterium sp. SM1]|uniref:PPE family protein, SVP subgroup n=1 Tax=Mycobacterium sp. SM1 TaxID=2816243 RepID=UPI001BCC3CF9|nr:PPE domain-containing protein [Mycobacterium sp. SM1]MBS4729189.1 PPE domain-containing protein [Mycobacterium sp. SM1]